MDYKAVETVVAENSNYNDMYILDIASGGDIVSMAEEYGLVINSGFPKIGKAKPLKMLVKVPGGKMLNLSRSIDGAVHYTSRDIKVEFSCFRPKSEWAKIRHRLELLQGQWLWFFFKDSAACWRGQLSVSMLPQKNKAIVTISAVCNPYGYNVTAYLGDNWLWNSFNFENDTIYNTPTEVKSL